jgi:AcrR family transcriptional regulator
VYDVQCSLTSLDWQDSICEIRHKRDKERKMPQPENNLSVRRTQKLLREALIELIEEQGFDALTVREIT